MSWVEVFEPSQLNCFRVRVLCACRSPCDGFEVVKLELHTDFGKFPHVVRSAFVFALAFWALVLTHHKHTPFLYICRTSLASPNLGLEVRISVYRADIGGTFHGTDALWSKKNAGPVAPAPGHP